jgi:hypothetical protein
VQIEEIHQERNYDRHKNPWRPSLEQGGLRHSALQSGFRVAF